MINASTFCTHQGLEPIGLYDEPINKLELLALAIAAQHINGGYYKRGGHSDFVNKIEDGEEVQRFELIKQANRFVLETIQQIDPYIITKELLAEASEMMTALEMDYMFKVLGDNMNDFESSIHQFLADDIEVQLWMHVGVVAYIPEYVERETQQRELTERSIGSKYIGTKGEAIVTEIEIISKRAATQWDGWNVNAITTDGNRVSFFTTKNELANKKGVFKIAAKVKDCGNVWKDPDIKETRLNYVR